MLQLGALAPAGTQRELSVLFPSAGLLGKARVQLQSYHSSCAVAGEEWSILGISSAVGALGDVKQHVTEAFQLTL